MESIKIILKGMTIGFANIIPGVSGGTFAFIFGIYYRLTEAIGNFFINKEKRKEYFFFLLKVFAGAGFSILLFAKALTFLLEYSQVSKQITYFFFIGLIGGSIPFIVKSHTDMGINLKRILILLIGIILILLTIMVKGESSENIDHNSPVRLLWVFSCGLFSGGAMIIPGFSGSALMVSLGEYENIVGLYLGNIKEHIIPIVFFSLGCFAGIIAFAKAVEICFRNFKAETLYFILGLIGASLIQIFFKTSEGFDYNFLPLLGVVLALLIGFSLAYFTSRIKRESTIQEIS
jgi:putative membrane protein